MDIIHTSSEELASQIQLLQVRFSKQVFEEALNKTFGTRAEIRKHAIDTFGKAENKTLIGDTSVYKCGKVMPLGCDKCRTFKLHCKLKTNAWVYDKEKCCLRHDTLCNGVFKASAVSNDIYYNLTNCLIQFLQKDVAENPGFKAMVANEKFSKTARANKVSIEGKKDVLLAAGLKG